MICAYALQALSESMRAHLRLNFDHEEARDEQVLTPCCDRHHQRVHVLPAPDVSHFTGSTLIKCVVCSQVLAAYPTTIRRRILRHLYLHHVRASYIFQGCRQKFLDALLGISKVRKSATRGLLPCPNSHGGRAAGDVPSLFRTQPACQHTEARTAYGHHPANASLCNAILLYPQQPAQMSGCPIGRWSYTCRRRTSLWRATT